MLKEFLDIASYVVVGALIGAFAHYRMAAKAIPRNVPLEIEGADPASYEALQSGTAISLGVEGKTLIRLDQATVVALPAAFGRVSGLGRCVVSYLSASGRNSLVHVEAFISREDAERIRKAWLVLGIRNCNT